MLEKLAEALAELREIDPHDLGHGETILQLQQLSSSFDAINARALAAFEAGGEWASDGARNAKAWLTACSGLAGATIGRRLHLGRAVRDLPVAEQAWAGGHIDATHVAALANVRTPATEEVLARDEAMLVNQAAALRHDRFVRVLAYWAQHADPDGTEERADAQRQRRRLHLSQSFDGLWLGDVVLDPIGGAIVSTQLSRIEQELFEADWADARARVGDQAGVTDLPRTASQRRADALVEMARRAGTAPADGRRPAPLIGVLVGYESLHGRICELSNGTVISPGSLVSWLDEAVVERIVFDPESRVIDVGARRRLFSGATRRAIEVRDRECYHAFCDVPADRCQVDHIEPYASGGLTTVDNGRLACGFHNRARHRKRRRRE